MCEIKVLSVYISRSTATSSNSLAAGGAQLAWNLCLANVPAGCRGAPTMSRGCQPHTLLLPIADEMLAGEYMERPKESPDRAAVCSLAAGRKVLLPLHASPALCGD